MWVFLLETSVSGEVKSYSGESNVWERQGRMVILKYTQNREGCTY